MPALCKLCDLPDWENEEFLAVLDELDLGFGRQILHRKHWEFGQAICGLRRLGCLTPDAVAVGVGSGHEHFMYYLANNIARVHATDIYGGGVFIASDAPADMLVHPEKYAPFPYREDRLVVQYMDGCDLKYPDDCFDIAFSFSAIEHFGSHERSGRAMQEMARVLRPGGVLVLTTEAILNQTPHPEFFLPDEVESCLVRPSGLRLIDDIDFTISPSLVAAPVDLSAYDPHVSPQIVCQMGDVVFTSVLLFLQKPDDWALPASETAALEAGPALEAAVQAEDRDAAPGSWLSRLGLGRKTRQG